MRKLMRKVARKNMEKLGMTQINKRPIVRTASGMPEKQPSFFSQHWREYVN